MQPGKDILLPLENGIKGTDVEISDHSGAVIHTEKIKKNGALVIKIPRGTIVAGEHTFTAKTKNSTGAESADSDEIEVLVLSDIATIGFDVPDIEQGGSPKATIKNPGSNPAEIEIINTSTRPFQSMTLSDMDGTDEDLSSIFDTDYERTYTYKIKLTDPNDQTNVRIIENKKLKINKKKLDILKPSLDKSDIKLGERNPTITVNDITPGTELVIKEGSKTVGSMRLDQHRYSRGDSVEVKLNNYFDTAVA